MEDDVPSFDSPVEDSYDPEAGEEGAEKDGYKHPVAAAFHLVFKVAALAMYLIFYYALDQRTSFVLTFIVVVLLLAFDFWTTKNVTGRLLVGLRWWNEIKEDGESVWKFESKAERSNISKVEWTVFWVGLLVVFAAWVIFLISNLFGLDFAWAILDAVAIAMQAANVYGYLKCARAAGKLKKAAQGYAVKTVVERATTGQCMYPVSFVSIFMCVFLVLLFGLWDLRYAFSTESKRYNVHEREKGRTRGNPNCASLRFIQMSGAGSGDLSPFHQRKRAAFFGSPMQDASPAASPAPSSGWKCLCCETENPGSAGSCSVCMVPKPAKQAVDKAAALSTPTSASSSSSGSSSSGSTSGFTFGFSTPTSSASSTGGANNPFGDTPALPASKGFTFGGAAAPTTPTTSKPAGFVFGGASSAPSTAAAAAAASSSSSSSGGASSGWKCLCCEANNPSSAGSCSVCMVPKPAEKAVAKAAALNTGGSSGFTFGAAPSTTSSSTPTFSSSSSTSSSTSSSSSSSSSTSSFTFGKKPESKDDDDSPPPPPEKVIENPFLKAKPAATTTPFTFGAGAASNPFVSMQPSSTPTTFSPTTSPTFDLSKAKPLEPVKYTSSFTFHGMDSKTKHTFSSDGSSQIVKKGASKSPPPEELEAAQHVRSGGDDPIGSNLRDDDDDADDDDEPKRSTVHASSAEWVCPVCDEPNPGAEAACRTCLVPRAHQASARKKAARREAQPSAKRAAPSSSSSSAQSSPAAPSFASAVTFNTGGVPGADEAKASQAPLKKARPPSTPDRPRTTPAHAARVSAFFAGPGKHAPPATAAPAFAFATPTKPSATPSWTSTSSSGSPAVFSFAGASNMDVDTWKCACCGHANPEALQECELCLDARQDCTFSFPL